ncbi:MAG: hypothetical protein ACRDHG_10380, partial [Anaerolineales bacterium]
WEGGMLQEQFRELQKGGRPFAEFSERVRREAAELYDVTASSREAAYHATDRLSYVGSNGAEHRLFGNGTVSEFAGGLTRHALGQLVERLDGPPLGWVGDERHASGGLRADVVNALIRHRDPVDLLVRHRGDAIRAVLSDEYSPFSHVDLVDLVGGALSALGDLGGDAMVWRPETGDELRAYLVLPRVVFGPDPGRSGPWSDTGGASGPGGGLSPAIYLSNSEIGTGKVRISGGLFRLVCSNGAIRWEADQGGLELVHRGLSARTLGSAVADALVGALRMSEDMAAKFISSQSILLRPGKVEALARAWGDKYGLALPSIDAWRELVGWEAGQNGRPADAPALFDLVNAATYAAQKFGPEEREQAERMAGALLYAELPQFVG